MQEFTQKKSLKEEKVDDVAPASKGQGAEFKPQCLQ
jgi:hypothetical protein